MNCNLTDIARKNGSRCRSFDCQPCREFIKEEGKVTVEELQKEIERYQKVIAEHENHTLWLDVKQILHDSKEQNKHFVAIARDLSRTRDSYFSKLENLQKKVTNYKEENVLLKKEIKRLKKE